MKKNNPILKKAKEILYNSTFQAICRSTSDNEWSRLKKLFWFICLLISCLTCAYFVYESLLIFFSQEVFTNTRTHYETSSLFPKITFCNKNPFTTKHSLKMIKAMNYDELLNNLNTEKINDEDKERIAHSINDILFECRFNMKPCGPSDFVKEYIDKNIGYCYSFNSVRKVNQTNSKNSSIYNGENFTANQQLHESLRAGIDYGLKMVLYVGFYDKLIPKVNTYVGGILKIGSNAYINTNYGGEVSAGFNTNIIVERYLESILPKPYSNCKEIIETKFSQIILDSNYEYTQDLCFELCRIQTDVNKCNCTSNDKFSFFSNVSKCATNSTCANQVKNIFTTDYFKEKCFDACPNPCKRTLFKTSMSASRLTGDSFVTLINNSVALREDFEDRNLDADSALNSMVTLNIYFDSLSYTESMETATSGSILSLISTIGGILSLFLGLSMLSLFELIEFGYESF